VLSLNESLSALDQETRAEVKRLLHVVRERSRANILHFTHSQADARDLADSVFVLRDGRCVPDGIMAAVASGTGSSPRKRWPQLESSSFESLPRC